MKIGVFLCTCGDTLTNTLEYSELETFAQTLPKVTHVETRTDFCQQQALQAFSQTIKEKKLDRIVMAGCSPQLHGYHFEEAASNAGLSVGQITYANIREHCAWVHIKEPEHASPRKSGLHCAHYLRKKISNAKLLHYRGRVNLCGAARRYEMAAISFYEKAIPIV